MTRIALIGAGNIAQAHVDAFCLAGAEIVGVCTRGEAGREFAERNAIPVWQNTPQTLMDACQPQAVLVLTQPSAYSAVLQALQPYNVPVLLEKPLGYTVAAAETLLPLLPETVFVGLNRRFYGNLQRAVAEIAEEGPFMAQITLPEREKDYLHRDDATRLHWPMLNHIHGLDMIRALTGMPSEVLGRSEIGVLPTTPLPRLQSVLYRTDRGHTVSFLSNLDSPGGWRIHLFLPKREIIFSPLERTSVKTLQGLQEWPDAEADTVAKPGFLAQAKSFLAGVQAPDQLPADWVGFEDALDSMRLVELLYPLPQGVSSAF